MKCSTATRLIASTVDTAEVETSAQRVSNCRLRRGVDAAALYNSRLRLLFFWIVITCSDMYRAKPSSLPRVPHFTSLMRPASHTRKTLQTWLANSGFPALRDTPRPSWLKSHNYFGIVIICRAFNMESFRTLWVRNYIRVCSFIPLALWFCRKCRSHKWTGIDAFSKCICRIMIHFLLLSFYVHQQQSRFYARSCPK